MMGFVKEEMVEAEELGHRWIGGDRAVWENYSVLKTFVCEHLNMRRGHLVLMISMVATPLLLWMLPSVGTGRPRTRPQVTAATLVRKSRLLSDPDPQTLGAQLRAARRVAGLSQGDLEVRSGIPKARLSRYENNHIVPALETFVRLCRALGVPPGQLLDAVYP